jgi:hypothetical protein
VSRFNPDEEMEMIKNRLMPALAVFALVGFAACSKSDSGSADVVTQDTITQPGTETVTVPNADTAVVTTQMSVDTSVSVDTSKVSK